MGACCSHSNGSVVQQQQQLKPLRPILRPPKPNNPNENSPKTKTMKAELNGFVEGLVQSEADARAIVDRCWRQIDQSKIEAASSLSSRVVRIFVSSTFVDFHSEREVLTKKVFAELRQWCVERDVTLLEIDLRWGVPVDSTTENTVRVCLTELERCVDETGGKPFFIGLLGERYGWVPAKKELTDELITKTDWVPNISVTHMEIVNGVLRRNNPNALFLLRDPNCLERVPPETRISLKEANLLPAMHMDELKRRIRERYPTQIINYSPEFTSVQDGRVRFSGMEGDKMADKVLNWLKTAIKKHFGLNDTTQSKGDAEDDLQQYHLHQLVTTFVGREAELKTLEKFIIAPKDCEGVTQLQTEEKFERQMVEEEKGNVNSLFYLSGSRGVGKTILLAAFAEMLHKSRKDLRLFYHFPSASIAAGSPSALLRRLTLFAGTKRNDQDSGDLEKISKECWRKLADSGKKTVVLFDGLDKLSSSESPSHLDWLPIRTPSNVTLFVSSGSSHRPTESRIEDRGPAKYELAPMSRAEQDLFVKRYFGQFGKMLDEQQIEALLTHSRSPDWLKLALDELRVFGAFDRLTDRIRSLPISLPDLIAQIMERMKSDDDDSVMSQKALCFLACAQHERLPYVHGLSEDALLCLLGDVDKSQPAPPIVWSRTRIAINSFIKISGSLVDLANEPIRQVIVKRILGHATTRAMYHRKLAQYFGRVDNLTEKQRRYPYHLIESDQSKEAGHFLLKGRDGAFMNPFEKQDVLMELKCNDIVHDRGGGGDAYLCRFCYMPTPGMRRCYLCGAMGATHQARLCNRHAKPMMPNCVLCSVVIDKEGKLGERAQICRTCNGLGPAHCCFVQLQ
uniref:NACHT domain-containing protein n=1 Tax=Plectus sambesii TaxID=2011161 RepID=A0A914W2W6_9BILA